MTLREGEGFHLVFGECIQYFMRRVFPKIGGKPPKWMVKIMENPIKMDDLGVPLFLETLRITIFNSAAHVSKCDNIHLTRNPHQFFAKPFRCLFKLFFLNGR